MGRFYIELYMSIFISKNFSGLGIRNSVVDSNDDILKPERRFSDVFNPLMN